MAFFGSQLKGRNVFTTGEKYYLSKAVGTGTAYLHLTLSYVVKVISYFT